MLGSEMDLKFVGYSPRFCGLKGLVQRCDFVGVEVVHYQHNFLGVRIQLVNKLLDDVRKVNFRASISYLDMSPPGQRLEQHEQVGRPVAFVFVIFASRLSRPGCYWRPCFADQLLAGFIKAYNRAFRIVWAAVNLQDVFHRGDKVRVLFWGESPIVPSSEV